MVPALAALLVPGGCSAGTSPADPPQPPEASVTSNSLAYVSTPTGVTLSLEVRRSLQERAVGMMGRDRLPEGTGMLFVFDDDDRHSFWMYGCLIPLDIVWLDAAGLVVHVAESVPPCPEHPCTNYEPDTPARYVIEVGAGRAAGLGLEPGARVLMGGLDAPGSGGGPGMPR